MEGTSFLEIYKLALTEIQDPQIKATYSKDKILFTKVMYNFLINAIPLFNSPIEVIKRVNNFTAPYEDDETFIGDGVKKIFVLSKPPVITDIDNIIFKYIVDGAVVSGVYDELTSSVVLDNVPILGSAVTVSYYFVGQFNIVLYLDEKYILSQWIVSCWSEYTHNNKLDIDRLLGDTDFKLYSNSTTTQAKTSWNIVNRECVTKRMQKYAWISSMLGTYK